MAKRKGQSLVEYVLATLLFVIIIIYLVYAYFDRLPEEISKIEEQELCSEAESIAISLLDLPGEPSNWEMSAPDVLGFSRNESRYYGQIDYNKWTIAVDRGYYNISNEIKLNSTFNIEYFIYALNLTPDTTPLYPNDSSPKTFIIRNINETNISAGSNTTGVYFNLTLFFPSSRGISVSTCLVGALEAGETPVGTLRDNGTEVVINWTVGNGDHDCISFSNISNSKLIYITRAIFKNDSIGKDYPIYAGNHTNIKDNFGSTEYKTLDKPYCEITRKRLIYNHSEAFPTRFYLRAW